MIDPAVRRLHFPIVAIAILLAPGPVLPQGTLLLQQPTISADHIAFAHGGDIWITSRSGGEATRLTTSEGLEVSPYFSPDGPQIAFSGA